MENLDRIIYDIYEIQSQYPQIFIGGSLSLILQEAIPYREIKDIDFVSKDQIHIYDVFKIDNRKKYKHIKHYNTYIRNDLFINHNALYTEFEYNGLKIKLSPIEEVIKWKLKFYKNFKKEKHLVDINNIYNKI